jgi:hypothetical protein
VKGGEVVVREKTDLRQDAQMIQGTGLDAWKA